MNGFLWELISCLTTYANNEWKIIPLRERE